MRKGNCYGEKDTIIIVKRMVKVAAECDLHGLVHWDTKL